MNFIELKNHFRERILAAGSAGSPLCIQGGGTKLWYGQSVVGEMLSTLDYRGVINYDPSELVITVRSGTPLVEVEELLTQHGQMLAFEPPHFGTSATVGGMVAAGISGPRRASVGAVRDFVLGLSLMNGAAEELHFGGQVMKNVAGYDVSRLMVGSLGCLGLILDVSIKTLPCPQLEQTLVFACSEAQAINWLNTWTGQPLPISASAYHVGQLWLRLSGSGAAVRAARGRLGGQLVDDGETFWREIREQTHPYFYPDDIHGLWRLSVPSTAASFALQGKVLLEWGGAQRWLLSDEEPEKIRSMAIAAGGHATLFRHGEKSAGVFTALTPPVAQMHQRLKQAFDPGHIFNRGRMYSDF